MIWREQSKVTKHHEELNKRLQSIISFDIISLMFLPDMPTNDTVTN
jgi:hypothetical protein